MLSILQQRGLKFIFAANLISMLGSGLNSAAVTWYILQATHSEVALGTLVVLQTVAAMVLLPFTGVLIDREDRRRLVMWLDAGRGLVILAIALLALYGKVQLWQLYVMNILVAAGFWMFWPTITALIQEMTPDAGFVHANTFLMAGVQGGWLIAGAFVGFLYNHIGLSGVLFIDVGTYVLSFTCYLFVRKGRHVVKPMEASEAVSHASGVSQYLHELKDGFRFLQQRPRLIALGGSYAMFLGAMLTQSILTAPLSDKLLHAGAQGFGWMNGGWGVGAFVSAWYAPLVITALGTRTAIALPMGAMAVSLVVLPFSPMLAMAVGLYAIMGTARGIGGVAMSSRLMELVPKHYMGRVQNTFYFAASLIQVLLGLTVGWVAEKVSLAAGFAMVGVVYAAACGSALWRTGDEEIAPPGAGEAETARVEH